MGHSSCPPFRVPVPSPAVVSTLTRGPQGGSCFHHVTSAQGQQRAPHSLHYGSASSEVKNRASFKCHDSTEGSVLCSLSPPRLPHPSPAPPPLPGSPTPPRLPGPPPASPSLAAPASSPCCSDAVSTAFVAA
ncbi:hypothetical protein BaRGS_00006046 [Batillaria attramentaria]|uniref:Uncharacterized protein n=1 Tax=Batillaria attramentaria TaxID=370345 RepID=A0ABD0LTG2_9CAEN